MSDRPPPPPIIAQVRFGIVNKITIEVEHKDRIEIVTLSEIAPNCGIVLDNGTGHFNLDGYALEHSVEVKKS